MPVDGSLVGVPLEIPGMSPLVGSFSFRVLSGTSVVKAKDPAATKVTTDQANDDEDRAPEEVHVANARRVVAPRRD